MPKYFYKVFQYLPLSHLFKNESGLLKALISCNLKHILVNLKQLKSNHCPYSCHCKVWEINKKAAIETVPISKKAKCRNSSFSLYYVLYFYFFSAFSLHPPSACSILYTLYSRMLYESFKRISSMRQHEQSPHSVLSEDLITTRITAKESTRVSRQTSFGFLTKIYSIKYLM